MQHGPSPRRLLGLLVLGACWAAGPAALAQSILAPLGLQPGDHYRLAFVTDGRRDAQSADIADYNAFVTQEARLAGSVVEHLDTEWFAIASTGAVDATANTNTDPSPPGDTGVPIYLLDGATRFASHYDQMWDGDVFGTVYLDASLNINQYNVWLGSNGSNNVWTGSDYYGRGGGIGGAIGVDGSPSIGSSLSPNGRWINNNFGGLESELRSFYAISSVLTVAPEPAAAALATLCLTFVGGLGRTRR